MTNGMKHFEEKLVFPILLNAQQQLIAAIILHNSKMAWTTSFFLASVAQEELAKLLLLPIARETEGLDNLFSDRRSAWYNHKIKQKLFSSYSLFERKHENIEINKQNSLYVNVRDGNAECCTVSPEVSSQEIQSALWVFHDQVKVINIEKEFSDGFKKAVNKLVQILGGCANDLIPEIVSEMKKRKEKLLVQVQNDKQLASKVFNEQLFKNRFEMIRIFKSLFGKDYKKRLEDVQCMSFSELVSYLEPHVQ